MREYKDIPFNGNQMLDMYLPDEDNFKLLVFFHGGGIESGDKSSAEPFAEYLTDRGIALVSADYRMYPKAKYPDFIEDAADAVAWVRNHIGDYGKCDDIYVGGSSAGGYLSMMLCFDKSYLRRRGIESDDFAGYIHDAGQPTVHFNVVRERGLDSRRVLVDEAAPLYHITADEKYAPMLFIVSDEDVPGRYEQTMLTKATLEDFGYRKDEVKLLVMHGKHTEYTYTKDEEGNIIFGKIIAEYIYGEK